MDASDISAMRIAGRQDDLRGILSDYFAHQLRAGDATSLAVGMRALLELEPAEAVRLWFELRSVDGFGRACGPGFLWKLQQADPGTRAWDAAEWTDPPAWIPARGAPLREAKPDILTGRAQGREELIDFRFQLRCPWCREEHEAIVRRTLVCLRRYACPGCEAPLKIDGRDLRRHIPAVADPVALGRYEAHLQSLWHDLHRAEGGRPPDAELLCQAFTSHLTRVASASLSSHAGR